jgi:hypothetical protein
MVTILIVKVAEASRGMTIMKRKRENHRREVMDEFYEKAIVVFGIEYQLHKVIEECNELLLALHDFPMGAVTDEELIEEIVDVEIMSKQLPIIIEKLKQAFGSDTAYDFIRKKKLERLERLVNKRLTKDS